MKKILLSIVTLIALTTTTLFGACTQDVNMSGNQIKDLGDASANGDAVSKGYADRHYLPTNLTEVSITDLNSSTNIVQVHNSLSIIMIKTPTAGTISTIMTGRGGDGVGYSVGFLNENQTTNNNSITIQANGTGTPSYTLSVATGSGILSMRSSDGSVISGVTTIRIYKLL